jgi:leucyl-tRNA synthetase
VAALMELTNLMHAYVQGGGGRDDLWRKACLDLTLLLSPFAPHLAEELWQRQGQDGLCAFASWPKADPLKLRRERVTVVVQVDGKLRERLEMPAHADERAAREEALRSQNVQRAIAGRPVKRAVFVPGRLINLVTE